MAEDYDPSSTVNRVIGGLYNGLHLGLTLSGQNPYVATGFFKKILINPETCESVKLQSDSPQAQADETAKQLDPTLVKGLEFLIKAGAAATDAVLTYNVVITYKDGQKSLANIDQNMWTRIQGAMFKG